MRVCNREIGCTVEGNGPPLLFLHGWGVGHDLYLPLLRPFMDRYTVYAPDLPGFGSSPEPEEAWDGDQYALFIKQFCNETGIVPSVCMGHSNGGRILLKLLGTEKLSADKLVLVDSAGLKPRRPLSYYIKIYAYKTAKVLLRPFPKVRERYIAGKGSADYKAASPVMRATMSKLLKEDLTPLLPRIKSETLLIWGEGDTATPLSDGKRMEKEIPGAGLAVLPGGHWAFMEQLPRTIAILEHFL